MSEFSDYSVEELQKIAGSDREKESDHSDYSIDELRKISGDDKFSMGPILENIASVGSAIDAYTGAPTRKAIGETIETGNPLRGAKAFVSQFGEDPSLAPTGKDLARKLGVPDTKVSDVLPGLYSETGGGGTFERGGIMDPSASGAAGLAGDIAADWTNVLPVGAAARLLGKTGKEALQIGTKAGAEAANLAARGADWATASKVGSKAIEGVENISERLGDTAQAIKSQIKPKIASDYDSLVEMYKKIGADPETMSSQMKYGPGSMITRLEKKLAEGATGQPLIESWQKGKEELDKALFKNIESISKGKTPSASEASGAIKKGLEDFKKTVFKNDDVTYDYVVKTHPGLYLSKESNENLLSRLNGIEKEAKGLATRGAKQFSNQGKAILAEIELFKKNKPTFKQVREFMGQLGDVAFKPGIETSEYTKAARDMYFSMRDALIETTKRHVSDEWADELVKNNKNISEYLQAADQIKNVSSGKEASENIIDYVFKDTNRAAAFKKQVSPETFNMAAQRFVFDAVKQNADQSISYPALRNKIINNQELFESVIGKDMTEKLLTTSNLGERYGDFRLSTSGTGASGSFKDLLTSPLTTIGAEVGGKDLLNYLKASAIDTTTKMPVNAPTIAKESFQRATKISPDVAQKYIDLNWRRMSGLRNSPIAQGAKGAQVVSVQKQNFMNENTHLSDEQKKNQYLEGN